MLRVAVVTYFTGTSNLKDWSVCAIFIKKIFLYYENVFGELKSEITAGGSVESIICLFGERKQFSDGIDVSCVV